MEAGLDALVFTNHHCLVPVDRLADLNAKYAPFRVYGGIEIGFETWEDVLVLGLHDPALEAETWTYPALHAYVRERNGLIALAHPYRIDPQIHLDIDACPPDAIEGRSHNTPHPVEQQIRKLAARLRVPLLSNSDSHGPHSRPGRYYNLLERTPRTEKDLIAALKAGRFTCHAPKTGHSLES